jgi:lysophospholipase L1-like esterase
MRLWHLACVLLVVATATTLPAATPAPPGRPYLALGDSVSFGFITQAGFEYVNPDNFIGFPNYVGQAFMFVTSNAACPGETTGSFLSSTAPDDGCRAYRAAAPLHVAYTSTQLNFALSFLKVHPATKLVTIGLGADDVLLLENACLGDPRCIENGLPEVLATVGANLETIIGALRATGFGGPIVVVNYYSVDYTDAIATGITELLNQTLADAAAAQGAIVADAFTAFKKAAAIAGGHTCNAGLLNALPQNQFLCDIHPSQSGQGLIAKTVEEALRGALNPL